MLGSATDMRNTLQTMSNTTNETIDEEIERTLPLSWLVYRSFPLVFDLSNAILKRYQHLGEIEYLEESITYFNQMSTRSTFLHPHGPCSHSITSQMPCLLALSSQAGWKIRGGN